MVRGFEWSAVIAKVAKRVPPTQFSSWLEPVQFVDVSDKHLTLNAPTTFSGDWVRDHYHEVFRSTVKELYGLNLALRVQTREPTTAEGKPPAPKTRQESELEAPTPITVSPPKPTRPGVDQRYTLDQFIVGASNQFAHAAAQAVAEHPGAQYNPLFIHGPVGAGKTHLLNAVGNQLLHKNPRAKVCLLSAETFANNLIEAIQAGKTPDFRKKYRDGYDVLLVDDVQFLGGKKATQEEFFHTFNSFYSAGRQVVFTSDRAPKDITGLEDRLRTRFEWGLTADIQYPEIETRIAILRARAQRDGFFLPNDVALFLATHIKADVRVLESALTRLGAQTSLLGREISLDLALQNFPNFAKQAPAAVSILAIQDAVCQRYSIKASDIKGKARTQSVVHARQIAMYLTRRYCKLSFQEISQHFGGRHHSTALYAVNTIERQIAENADLAQEVEAIQNAL